MLLQLLLSDLVWYMILIWRHQFNCEAEDYNDIFMAFQQIWATIFEVAKKKQFCVLYKKDVGSTISSEIVYMWLLWSIVLLSLRRVLWYLSMLCMARDVTIYECPSILLQLTNWLVL